MNQISLIFCLMLTLVITSCAFVIRTGERKALNDTDSLAVYVIETSKLEHNFHKAAFVSNDQQDSLSAFQDLSFQKDEKLAIVFFPLPFNKAYYLADIQSLEGGFLAGRDYISNLMSVQQSPVVFKSVKPKEVLYGGAISAITEETGFFEQGKFSVQKCQSCPSEKEIFKHLIKIAKTSNLKILNDEKLMKKIKSKAQ